MRILVVSDIHANWPALAAIDEPHDFAICLGDLVDYGPDPVLCVRWAMEHARYSIRGNHDHGVAQGVAVLGESGYRYLTRVTRPMAAYAIIEGNKVELKRVAYPVQETIARLERTGLPGKAKAMLGECYRSGRLIRSHPLQAFHRPEDEP